MVNTLDLTIGQDADQSYLKDMYFTRPFKIANISEYAYDKALYLMLMSSSPGILDKDHYCIKIHLEPSARLLLQSQSYQRLFQMKVGATQTTDITLEKGAHFSYIQHPVVPHHDSIFDSSTQVYLSEGSVFTYSEIVTCGRKLSGEIFLFKKFRNITSVYLNKKLILKDHLLLEPSWMKLGSLGMLEEYTHQATFIHIDTCRNNFGDEILKIDALLSDLENVIYGISQADESYFIIRLLGYEGEQIYAAFKKIETYLWELKKNG